MIVHREGSPARLETRNEDGTEYRISGDINAV